MSIKAFIFDVDGVLTDTVELHYCSWVRLAQEEGIPFSPRGERADTRPDASRVATHARDHVRLARRFQPTPARIAEPIAASWRCS